MVNETRADSSLFLYLLAEFKVRQIRIPKMSLPILFDVQINKVGVRNEDKGCKISGATYAAPRVRYYLLAQFL